MPFLADVGHLNKGLSGQQLILAAYNWYKSGLNKLVIVYDIVDGQMNSVLVIENYDDMLFISKAFYCYRTDYALLPLVI